MGSLTHMARLGLSTDSLKEPAQSANFDQASLGGFSKSFPTGGHFSQAFPAKAQKERYLMSNSRTEALRRPQDAREYLMAPRGRNLFCITLRRVESPFVDLAALNSLLLVYRSTAL